MEKIEMKTIKIKRPKTLRRLFHNWTFGLAWWK